MALKYNVNYLAGQQKRPEVATDCLHREKMPTFFPDELGGLTRRYTRYIKDAYTAKAYYGSKEIQLTIIDDAYHQYKGIERFNADYNSQSAGQGFIKVRQVRKGYKTIALVDWKKKQCSVTFVYGNRFIIKIEGLDHQTPYRLWSYVELHKFKELDEHL